MTIAYWIIALFIVIVAIAVLYIKRVPHGWVQFRTGLVLKFMPPLDHVPVVQLRQSLEDYIRKKLPAIKKELPVQIVRDITIPTRHGDIEARIFQNDEGPFDKALVFIHGGGWCVGSVTAYEEVCRRLTISTRLPVISLEYSLGPEHKFPIAHEECLDAIKYLAGCPEVLNIKYQNIVLLGDSAGGNLIISSWYSSEEKVQDQIAQLVAIYPAVDSRNGEYQSKKLFKKGYYLTQKAMDQFTEGLISDEKDLQDIRLSPIFEASTNRFPRCFVLTAAFDPLRDQSEAFADKIRREGNAVVKKRYQETVHAFFGLRDFGSRGLEAIEDVAAFIDSRPVKGAN